MYSPRLRASTRQRAYAVPLRALGATECATSVTSAFWR